MTPKRIVYCLDTFDIPGGVERIVTAKANYLAAIPGYKVYIVLAYLQKKPSFPLDSRIDVVNLDVPYYKSWNLPAPFQTLYLFWAWRKHRIALLRLLNSLKPDIVFLPKTTEVRLLSQRGLKPRPQLIHEVHFSWEHDCVVAQSTTAKLVAKMGQSVYLRALKKIDKIVLLSESERTEYWDRMPFRNVRVIPNYVLSNTRDCPNFQDVIACGRLVPSKGFHDLLKAWKTVVESHPDWHLTVYGEGSERLSLQRQMEEYAIGDNVSLPGFSSNIIERMAEASVFCMTSISEGLPMVMLEAMSVGLPIVAFDIVGGVRDLVQNGINGFRVPYGDTVEMANKISYLIEHPQTRKDMGRQSLRIVQEKYTADAVMPQWIELIEKNTSLR